MEGDDRARGEKAGAEKSRKRERKREKHDRWLDGKRATTTTNDDDSPPSTSSSSPSSKTKSLSTTTTHLSRPPFLLLLLQKKKLNSSPSSPTKFSKQEHKTDPKIKELNPRQQIPTFEDGETGAVVNESLAAVLFLDSTYKNSGTELVPSGDSKEASAARGLVYQRVFEAANLHAAMRDVVYPKMRGLLKTDEDEKEWKEVKVEALKAELARWESYLTDNDDWLVPAASFSAADLAVAVLVLAIQRFGASLDAFPKLQKYAKKSAERPSVAETWPPHWKEGEGPGFIKGML